MIRLHKLNGAELVVNAELIESVETHGVETVIKMATGNQLVVHEPVSDVIAKVVEYKKTVFVGAVYLPDVLRGDPAATSSAGPSEK